jgi:excisionase family DNA binding protein
LRVGATAAALSCSRSKVYEMVATGELPAVRLGSSIRIPYAAIEKLVQDAMGSAASGLNTES